MITTKYPELKPPSTMALAGDEKKQDTDTKGYGDGLVGDNASSLDYDNARLAGWLLLIPFNSVYGRFQAV